MKKAVSCEHHFTARWKGRGGQPSHRPGGSEAAFISTLQLDSVLPRLGMLRRLTGPASRFDHSQRCSGPVLPKSLSAFHASQRSRRGRRQSLSIAGKHCSSGCFAFFVCCCSSGDGAIVEVHCIYTVLKAAFMLTSYLNWILSSCLRRTGSVVLSQQSTEAVVKEILFWFIKSKS